MSAASSTEASETAPPAALRALFEEHYDFAYRSALRLGVTQAAVDDVVLFAGDVETPLQRVEDLRACADGGFESTLIATDGGERLVLCPEACAAYQFASLQEMGGLRVTVCE